MHTSLPVVTPTSPTVPQCSLVITKTWPRVNGIISRNARTDFVERIRYACDDSDSNFGSNPDPDPGPDSGRVSAVSARRRDSRESGVVMMALSGLELKDDGEMGGYLAAISQKGQRVEVMVLGLYSGLRSLYGDI